MPKRAILVAVLATACGDDSGGTADAPASDASINDAGADVGGGADGAPDAFAPVTLTILASVGGLQQDLTWVAGQDGDGAWQVLTGGGGAYSLTVTAGPYSLAYVCPEVDFNGWNVTVLHATAGEWPNPTIRCFANPELTAVSGTVAGLGIGESARVTLGRRSVTTTGAYSLSAEQGTWDAVAQRFTSATALDRIIIDRDVSVPPFTITHSFDFAGGFSPSFGAVTVTGVVGTETATFSSELLSRRGGGVTLQHPPPGMVAFVPTAQLLGADINEVIAYAGNAEGNHSVAVYRAAPADLTLALPPYPNFTASAPGTPIRYGVQLAMTAEDSGFAFNFQQYDTASSTGILWTAIVSAGWLGGTAGDKTYQFPDLFTLAGWNPAWDPLDGLQVRYDLGRVRSNRGFTGLVVHDLERASREGLDGLDYSYAWRASELIP